MQLILALMLAVQSSVVLAATTANEESMDKAELFYKCLDDYGTRGASIEEEMQTRFFCKDKVDHTHHTPEQIVDEAKKGIADRHRRCAGAAQDDVSCMLWRYDPTSRLYIKCLALNGGRETDEVMNYCVIADREFRQCTQGNEGKVPSSVIEEYCLSGKVNGREVNVQRQATNSVEASRSPSNAKAQLPANNAASTGDFAKSFLAFLGAIYAIGTVAPFC